MFGWVDDHRRRKILESPFPDGWEAYIAQNMVHWKILSEEEREHLRQLVQVFGAEKHWKGCGGLELTQEVIATISAQACLLLLGLDHRLYRDVDSILVYPTTVKTPERAAPLFPTTQVMSDGGVPILGEAIKGGPVILVWDSVTCGGRHPERGHNVVYHEFAHKLDMAESAPDGTPPQSTRAGRRHWIEVCQAEFDDLQKQLNAGQPTSIDPYGATNVAEFFAVVTEHFFDTPIALRSQHLELYNVFSHFYKQDTALREERFLAASGGR